MRPGPRMPGAAASGSEPHSQAEREPSRIATPSRSNVSVPSTVLQAAALSLVTCGTVPMSA